MKCLSVVFAAVLVSFARASEDACVAILDSKVHFPSSSDTITLNDVGNIITREIGIEEFPSSSSSALPTGDIFSRPKANLLVIVDNIGLGAVMDNSGESFPNLFKMFSSNVTLNLDSIPKTNDPAMLSARIATLDDTKNLAYRLRDAFPNSMIHSVSGDERSAKAPFCTCNDATMKTVPGRNPETMQWIAKNGELSAPENINLDHGIHTLPSRHPKSVSSEMALCSQVLSYVSKMNDAKVEDSNPDLFVFRISSVRDTSDLVAFESKFFDLLERFSSMYNGRTATQVVLLGENSVSMSSSKRGLAGVTEEDIAGHLLLVWTCIILALIIFLLFCCVNWTAEMDPILTSGFKSDDHGKKE